MFDDRTITELKKVIGYRDHWDVSEIPALPASLTGSESGQYYQDFHPLVRLDYIQALLPSNYTLDAFLDDIETSSIKQALNKMASYKKLNNAGMDLARNNLIFDNVIKDKPIVNEGRFVGIQFALDRNNIGLRAIINRIGLYLTQAQTLTLYLFNSLSETAINQYTFVASNNNTFEWLEEQILMDYSDASNNLEGGVWYLGYYQADLTGQAIRYDTLNWKNGYCKTCDNGTRSSKFTSISSFLAMAPFYVPPASLSGTPTDMFDTHDMIYDYTNNFGFNFNISIACNLTQFWIDNRLTMVNAIGKTVALKILEMMKASSQISAIEQNIQINIIRDLEGDRETKATPFWAQAERAIKATNFDQGNVNTACVPCSRKGITYTTI